LLAFLVENESDDDVIADNLYIEGHEVSGQTIVSKRPVIFVVTITVTVRPQSDSLKGIVIDIDSSLIEVGGVKIAIALNDGAREPGVAGAIGGLDYDNAVRGGARCATGSYSNIWVPSGEGAIKSGEEKSGSEESFGI
jgi:hypothetical protein